MTGTLSLFTCCRPINIGTLCRDSFPIERVLVRQSMTALCPFKKSAPKRQSTVRLRMTVNSYSVVNDPRHTAIFVFPTTSSGIPMAPTAPGDSISPWRYSSGKKSYRATETAAPVSNRILVGTLPTWPSAYSMALMLPVLWLGRWM